MNYLHRGARHVVERTRQLFDYLSASAQEKEQISQILYEFAASRHFSRYVHVLKDCADSNPAWPADAGKSSATIWQLWFQGEDNVPDIVKTCLRSVVQHIPDHDRVLLTERTIDNYVCIPGYIYDKKKRGQISNAHFSDILRTCLLSEHGGTWMDATVYLTAKPRSAYLQLPLFFFSRAPVELLGYGHILGSSWYLRATMGNVLIDSVRRLLLEYWKHESNVRHYYCFHLMLALAATHSEACRRCVDDMPFYSNVPPHLMQFELFKPYDPHRLEEIKRMSDVHKLTFYGGSEFDANRKATLYQHLIG